MAIAILGSLSNMKHKSPIIMDDFILNQLLNFCFDDEETASPDYYKEQICRWLYENGLIESDNGNWIRPKGEEDD